MENVYSIPGRLETFLRHFKMCVRLNFIQNSTNIKETFIIMSILTLYTVVILYCIYLLVNLNLDITIFYYNSFLYTTNHLFFITLLLSYILRVYTFFKNILVQLTKEIGTLECWEVENRERE